MKVGKPKSKRVPVRLRHKIEKASAAKQRKERKEAKKNPQWRSRLKKDPGIPNLFPYKDKILAEVEESRRRKEEETQRRRELAKAQRNGTAIDQQSKKAAAAGSAGLGEDEDGDEVFHDAQDGPIDDDEDEDMTEESSNPMAALLASAQVRAQTYAANEDDEEEDEDDVDDEEEEEWGGIKDKKKTAQPTRRTLPKQALADPVKAVSILLTRLEKIDEGIQQLLDYYQIPPLVTAGSDLTSRFLVDVARKRGRLGRGGIPNLHAAALTVLGDINDERLKIGALENKATVPATANKGDVQIVSKLAEPFRIEGLFDGNEA